jgi:hypothetical protein
MRTSDTLEPLLEEHSMASARLLAEAIKDVAVELRLTDAADFVTYIHAEKFANIQDIVDSSVELFFKHGTLVYGTAADFTLTWDGPPSVTIDLEFRHKAVTARFAIILRALEASVDVKKILFEKTPDNAEEAIGLLRAALADARLPPASRRLVNEA